MYNGIGLVTPRGSGTNGHVQRNWAFLRPGKKDNVAYKTEEDLSKLDAASNRQPNQEILDHERKRKIEVKCAEFEEILERQGFSAEEVLTKVESYRKKIMAHGLDDIKKNQFGRVMVRETHQIAEAQQQKNAKLREAFGLSEYFVDGSSFDTALNAKEELAKSAALQAELQSQKNMDKERNKKYGIVRTPSPERDRSNEKHAKKSRTKRERSRSRSVSPEHKKAKKKKSKKNKKEKRKKHRSTKRRDSSTGSDSGDSSNSDDDSKRKRKLKKKKKKRQKEKKHSKSHLNERSSQRHNRKLPSSIVRSDTTPSSNRSQTEPKTPPNPPEIIYTNKRDAPRTWESPETTLCPEDSKSKLNLNLTPELREPIEKEIQIDQSNRDIGESTENLIVEKEKELEVISNQTIKSGNIGIGSINNSDIPKIKKIHKKNVEITKVKKETPDELINEIDSKVFNNRNEIDHKPKNIIESEIPPQIHPHNRNRTGECSKSEEMLTTNSEVIDDKVNKIIESETPPKTLTGKVDIASKRIESIEVIHHKVLNRSDINENLTKPLQIIAATTTQPVNKIRRSTTPKQLLNFQINKKSKLLSNNLIILNKRDEINKKKEDSCQKMSTTTVKDKDIMKKKNLGDDSTPILAKLLSPVSQKPVQNNSSSEKVIRKNISNTKEVIKRPLPILRLDSLPNSDDEINEDDCIKNIDRFVDPIEPTRSDDLLKALPGIAAKAKEKIKSMSELLATKNNSLPLPSIHKITSPEISSTSHQSVKELNGSKSGTDIQMSENQKSDQNKDSDNQRRSSSVYSSRNNRSRSRASYTSRGSSRSSYRSRSRSTSSSGRSNSSSSTTSRSRGSSRSRSLSIPRRRGSPSFLDRRRITSARKRPIPYHRTTSPSPSTDSSYDSDRSARSFYRSESRSRSRSRSPR